MTAPPAPDSQNIIHASSIAIDGHAVLILGPSGAGKSDLALRLIDRGALLLSDDYTRLAHNATGTGLLAHVADQIAGLMEVRGVGIVRLPYLSQAPVALVVELVGDADPPVDRFPSEVLQKQLMSYDIPMIRVRPFEATTPIKVEYALRLNVSGHGAMRMAP